MYFEKLAANNPSKAIEIAEKFLAENSLAEFIKQYWHVVEPENKLVWGWTMDALCDHLEAVTRGDLRKVILNVPPGFSKSLIVNVFWPAWEWGPKRMPSKRYLCFSYSQRLTIRDNERFLRIISDKDYRKNWGDVFRIAQESVILVSNSRTGWKLASSVGGVATGERGDRIIIDDGNNVQESESDAIKLTTNTWVRETMPDRLNDLKTGAIVNIQQRTAEDDVTGTLLEFGQGYEHLMIPMEFDPSRKCYTSIGWEDPREEEGELAFPSRFPPDIVDDLKLEKGPYAWAGQYQQSPEPRGGGILKTDWWQLWDKDIAAYCGIDCSDGVLRYPPMEYIIQFTDTAYTDKEENDPSAGIVLGVFKMKGVPKIIMMDAWCEHFEFNDLLQKIISVSRRRNIDALIIEGKASGKSIIQEIKRTGLENEFTVIESHPDRDKVARVHSIVPLFAAGAVYAPDKEWAQRVIDQCSVFPKGKHDDLVDCISGGLGYLRKSGIALLPTEGERMYAESMEFRSEPEPLYDV